MLCLHFWPIRCDSHVSLFLNNTNFPIYSYDHPTINSVVHLCYQMKWGESPVIKTHHGWNGKEWPALVGSPLTRSLAHPCVPQWLCLDANLNEKRLNKNEQLSEEKNVIGATNESWEISEEASSTQFSTFFVPAAIQQRNVSRCRRALWRRHGINVCSFSEKSLCSYALFKVSKAVLHTQNEFCRSW